MAGIRNGASHQRMATYLWHAEYALAEARAGHIATGRHVRCAASSLVLAAIVVLGKVWRTRR
jgi:hypothetical protein